MQNLETQNLLLECVLECVLEKLNRTRGTFNQLLKHSWDVRRGAATLGL